MPAPSSAAQPAIPEPYESFPPPAIDGANTEETHPQTGRNNPSSGAAPTINNDEATTQTAAFTPLVTVHHHDVPTETPEKKEKKAWFQDRDEFRRFWWAKGIFTTCMLIAWIVAGWTLGRRRVVANGLMLGAMFGIIPWFLFWLARLILTWPLLRLRHKHVEVSMMAITGLVHVLVFAFYISLCTSSTFEG